MSRGPAMGYVDLHSHLLWGIDDGCETPDETLAAARLLVELGFSDVAASPHADPALPSGDPATCEARRAEAVALLDRARVPLLLHAGAENRLDDAFLERASGPGRRGIGRTGRWALVELPFRQRVPALPDLVQQLRRSGVAPLVAHPERCAEFERAGRAEEIVGLGAALQLNVGALVGVYGPAARGVAERLLDAGLYAVAATDLHQPRGAVRWLGAAIDVLGRRAGRDGLERLLAVNPRRILEGEEVS